MIHRAPAHNCLQVWPSTSLRLRVSCKGDGSFVVEAAPFEAADAPFSFVRIAHLSPAMVQPEDPLAKNPAVAGAVAGPSAPAGSMFAGVFACCPEDQSGCTATFHDFSVESGMHFEHNADGNH